MYTHRIRYLYFYKWEISCTSTYEILTLEQSEENVGLQSVLNYSWQTIRVQWSQERKSTERSTQFQIVKTNVILLTASKNESSKNRGVIKSETSCQHPLTENERSFFNFMHLKKRGEKKQQKTTTHGEFKKKKKGGTRRRDPAYKSSTRAVSQHVSGVSSTMCTLCQTLPHCVACQRHIPVSVCIFGVSSAMCTLCQTTACCNLWWQYPVSEPDHVMRKINWF